MISPNLTTDNIPDEVLLEIFDSYRQHFTNDQSLWNKKHKWFELIHVCRRWRFIIFASSTRLDLCLVVSTNNPGNMKTIFSPHLPPLPIAVDQCLPVGTASHVKAKEMGRVLSALKRCNRVRGITFSGIAPDFNRLFKATKHPFPMLENLELCNLDTGITVLKLPATFLNGSAPHLQSLKLYWISLTSMSSLLSSTTMLTELCLRICTSSPTASLLAHLKDMHCLRHFKLQTLQTFSSINSLMPPTNPEDTFLLSKLTSFQYQGSNLFLNALVAGFTAPSLQDVHFILDGDNDHADPISHLSRFLDGVEKLYHSVQMISEGDYFRISLFTHSEPVDHDTPSFSFCSVCSPVSIMRMSAALSAKLSTVEELFIVFIDDYYDWWDGGTRWPAFLQHFHNVKVLRLEHEEVFDLADTMQLDDEPILNFLPMLEEIEIHLRWAERSPASPHQNQHVISSELGMAAFRQFLAARQEAGRPVKIFGSQRAPFPDQNLHTLFCSYL